MSVENEWVPVTSWKEAYEFAEAAGFRVETKAEKSYLWGAWVHTHTHATTANNATLSNAIDSIASALRKGGKAYIRKLSADEPIFHHPV